MLNQRIRQLVKREKADLAFAQANSRSVQRTADGMGPDSPKVDPRAGARMTVNMSSAHIPMLCKAAAGGAPGQYKNCYDLGARISTSRIDVDNALPLPAGVQARDIYFGAIELNGSGIRFYGDICLVLKRDTVPADAVILDRNSYDVVRSPSVERVQAVALPDQQQMRRALLRTWSGQWSRDLGAMAALKAINTLGLRERRWTIGQISSAIRDDEDYIEVLKHGTFGAAQVQEARLGAADAAHDALVQSRIASGQTPKLASMIWSDRRRVAEQALHEAGVPLRIVVGSGRTRD